MRNSKNAAAGFLIPLIFAACVHVDFPAQAVTRVPVGMAKLPLKVAVVAADPSLTIHLGLSFYEKMNPGLAETVCDALAPDFQKVVVVDDRLSGGDADLLAIATAEVHFYGEQKLTVTFVEPHTGKTITEISSVKPFDGHAPGTHDHLGTDIAFMELEIALPPLIFLVQPTMQRHDAERFNAGFGPTLVAVASDVAAQASKDQAIESLPSRQPTTEAQTRPVEVLR